MAKLVLCMRPPRVLSAMSLLKTLHPEPVEGLPSNWLRAEPRSSNSRRPPNPLTTSFGVKKERRKMRSEHPLRSEVKQQTTPVSKGRFDFLYTNVVLATESPSSLKRMMRTPCVALPCALMAPNGTRMIWPCFETSNKSRSSAALTM